MTLDQIDKLEAGESLDILIHEKVFDWHTGVNGHGFKGWMVNETGELSSCQATPENWSGQWVRSLASTPNYSTSIEAAWRVVEKIRKYRTYFEPFSVQDLGDTWKVGFFSGGYDDYEGWRIEDKSFPLAVCKAALKVVISKE